MSTGVGGNNIPNSQILNEWMNEQYFLVWVMESEDSGRTALPRRVNDPRIRQLTTVSKSMRAIHESRELGGWEQSYHRESCNNLVMSWWEAGVKTESGTRWGTMTHRKILYMSESVGNKLWDDLHAVHHKVIPGNNLIGSFKCFKCQCLIKAPRQLSRGGSLEWGITFTFSGIVHY